MKPEIAQVVQLMRRKDPKSLDKALALLQNTVFSFSMKVCGQRQDAEDTTQEVLLKSVPYLPKFESPQALSVWLYKVAKNRCLMNRRKSKFAPRSELSLEQLMPERSEMLALSGHPGETVEKSLIRRESAKQVREAIRKLPPAYRLILVLHDMEELSDADIAEITGLRLGTIRIRLHRARLFIRKELSIQSHRHMSHQTELVAAGSHAPQPLCREMFRELSNYLDDEMDDSLCEELEKHMEGCEPCKVFLSSLEKSIEQCKAASAESPDPSVAARLRRRLLAEYQSLMARVTKAGQTEKRGTSS